MDDQLWEPIYKSFEGKQIFDNIRLIELLGQGGFGSVYKASNVVEVDNILQSTGNLAVKLIPVPQLINANELLAKFDHPNLIKYDLGGIRKWQTTVNINNVETPLEFYCLQMELADESLRGPIQDIDKLTKIVKDIASGLAYLHDPNNHGVIVHRDLKPANVLRVGNNWKISDFGLVRGLGEKDWTKTIHLAGTLPYVPPEYIDGIVCPGFDIWSLGVMIVELWTGQHPFKHLLNKLQANNELSIISYLKWLNTNEAQPIIEPALPEPLNKIVKGCLEKDFEKRLTAKQILEILNPPTPPKFRFKVVTVNNEGKIINKEWKEAEYYEENLGKGVILEMVKIPAGEFMMGSVPSEAGRYDNEGPQHKVTIAKPFYMSKYPITQGQYEVIMGQNPSSFQESYLPERSLQEGWMEKMYRSIIGENRSYSQRSYPNRPVECVSWDKAQEFCKRLSENTGKQYSLPSEAKWEYAARAGTTTPFHYGETLTTDIANYDGNYTYGKGPKGIYRKETTDVGIFPPNSFGLYDIHGNVWEWCEDTYHPNYEGAPNDGSTWVTNDENYSERPLRGGSWYGNPHYCRVAYRYNLRTYFNNNVGFRVSCAVV